MKCCSCITTTFNRVSSIKSPIISTQPKQVAEPVPKYTRKDLEIANKTNETIVYQDKFDELVPFSIYDSSNCKFFIFEALAQVTIDQVSDSFIYIGPTQDSIFVRDCKDLVIISASNQLRLKSCTNIKLIITCSTAPVIEKSTKIDIMPFYYFYRSLIQQFEKAAVPIFHNEWSKTYDFTPSEDKNFTIKNLELELIQSPSPQIEIKSIFKRAPSAVYTCYCEIEQFELLKLISERDVGIFDSYNIKGAKTIVLLTDKEILDDRVKVEAIQNN